MAKKYETVTQNLGAFSVYGAYQANVNYTADQITAKCREDLNSRNDVAEDFKKQLLSRQVGKYCEIVYYPVYFYNTSTDLSWTTTSTRNSDIYEGGQFYNVTTTTTTSHSNKNLTTTSLRSPRSILQRRRRSTAISQKPFPFTRKVCFTPTRKTVGSRSRRAERRRTPRETKPRIRAGARF